MTIMGLLIARNGDERERPWLSYESMELLDKEFADELFSGVEVRQLPRTGRGTVSLLAETCVTQCPVTEMEVLLGDICTP